MEPSPRIRLTGLGGAAAGALLAPLRGAGFEAELGLLGAAAAHVVLVAGEASKVLPDACRAARAATDHARVLACVPRDAPTQLQAACISAGAHEVIEIPIDGELLVARLRAVCAHVDERDQREAAERALAVADEIGGLLLAGDGIDALPEAAAQLAEILGFNRCAVLAFADPEAFRGARHPAAGAAPAARSDSLAPAGSDGPTMYLLGASDEPALTRLPLRLSRYPELRAALESRAPVYIENAATSELLGEYAPLAAERGGRCLLAVPLLDGARAIGALLLRAATESPPLDERARRLCRIVSHLFALALHGAPLTEGLREQTRRVTVATVDVERRTRALDQYRDFFESAADGVFVVDGDSRIIYMNRSAEQLTGYSRSGLHERKLHNIVPEEQRDALTELVRHAAAGVYVAGFDLAVRTTSGEVLRLSVSTSAALAEHGAVVLSFRDVTIARALEEELRKTKDFLERLIDSTVDAIIAADVDGNVLIFNQGAERAFGYAADEVVGRLPVWRLYPEGVARQIMADIRAPEHGGAGRLAPSRREILTKSGEVVPVSLTASIVYEDGREVASVGIVSDLRERLTMERRLAQAQEKLALTEKQELLTQVAGTAAHELNQPLTAISAAAELLKRRLGGEGDAHARAISMILEQSARMAQIVTKIGRITKFEFKPYVGDTKIIDLDKSSGPAK